MKTLSTAEFIERAQKVHGNRYDYSKVEYVNNSTKVTIICPKHGEFQQAPAKHISGAGCLRCAGMAKLNTAEFVERARKVHGEVYDYSKVNYVNTDSKVVIICSIHGDFEQTPYKHTRRKHGCPKCAGNYPHLVSDFIERAQKRHGCFYDYSKVVYVGSQKHVTIICPKHGEFQQAPANHISGNGCFKCAGQYRYDTASYIERAKSIHGDRYDYSKTKYVNSLTKVTFICRIHGEWQASPETHILRNVGCPKCGINTTADKRRLTFEDFVNAAREKHGEKYDYSNVEYLNVGTKVIIACPEHGEFIQTPRSHIHSGNGCPECGGNKPLTTQDFIDRAQAVHGDRYDYSATEFSNSTTKVSITCNEHGQFMQVPHAHLKGCGCTGCADSGIDMTAPGILYYLRVKDRVNCLWKIGITNNSVEERFSGRDIKKITILSIWPYEKTSDAFKKEQQILAENGRWRYFGIDKPLSKAGNTELFIRDVLGLDLAASRAAARITRYGAGGK